MMDQGAAGMCLAPRSFKTLGDITPEDLSRKERVGVRRDGIGSEPFHEIAGMVRQDAHAVRGDVQKVQRAIGGIRQTESGMWAGFNEVNANGALALEEVQGGQRPATSSADNSNFGH